MTSRAPLRIEPHPRGHIASCNGRINNVGARVEHSYDAPENAVQTAAVFQDWSRKEKERKVQELARFQKNVKSRVLEKEKAKQQQLVADSTKRVQSEQRAAEKAVNLDRIKTQQSVVVGQDIEDVKVMASGRDTFIPHQRGKPSSSQLARKNLLLRKGSPVTTAHDISSVRKQPQKSKYSPILNSTKIHYLTHHSEVDPPQEQSLKGPSKQNLNSPQTSLRRYTAPGQLEHEQKKQAGLQYLLFRRLYSDLEREQARQKHLQKVHTTHVDHLKRQKETARRIVEDEMNVMDSFSSISTEAMDDQQRAVEWAEIMALEERKQKLQKAREMERYIQALKARLKEKLDSNQLCVPPLCLCGTSVWDTNPDTCANNCVFYRNPNGYAKALSNLLSSLEISQQL